MSSPRLISPNSTASYFVLPYKRNQDRVKVYSDYLGTIYAACVIDGWHDSEFLSGNKEGQEVAEFVLRTFPRMFLMSSIENYSERAQFIADLIDKKILESFPKHVSCVGTFIFKYSGKTIITTIGTITTLVLQNNIWVKPKEIKDNKLDWRTNESGSATFFGRGELKNNKKYSNRIDTIVYPYSIPVVVFTDGVDDIIDYQQLPNMPNENIKDEGISFMKAFLQKILLNKNKQRDDIAALLVI